MALHRRGSRASCGDVGEAACAGADGGGVWGVGRSGQGGGGTRGSKLAVEVAGPVFNLHQARNAARQSQPCPSACTPAHPLGFAPGDVTRLHTLLYRRPCSRTPSTAPWTTRPARSSRRRRRRPSRQRVRAMGMARPAWGGGRGGGRPALFPLENRNVLPIGSERAGSAGKATTASACEPAAGQAQAGFGGLAPPLPHPTLRPRPLLLPCVPQAATRAAAAATRTCPVRARSSRASSLTCLRPGGQA